MFAVIFICGNLFLRIAGKIAKIRTCKNFVPHGRFRIWRTGDRRYAPTKGSQEYPRGWWLAKLDCDLFFFTLSLYSLEEFIVDDDDEDLEEEVFEDPGYQEEFDFGSDKENDDFIEIATPGRLPFLKRIKSLETKANLVLDLLTKFLDSSTFFG